MHWIIQFIGRHKDVSSLLLTVLLSLWMLSVNSTKQQQIARTLTLSIFYPFQFTFQQVTRAHNIYKENKRLREELTQVKTRIDLLEEKASENLRLRSLLGFGQDFTYNLLPARVVAREPSHLYRSMVINAGKKQGIGLYMPIVTKDGLVGKVIQTLPNISLTQILKDPSARTSVMVKRTRFVGILETENGRSFFIRYRNHVDVQPGDTIITSGLGGIYPKGLSVGEVTKIANNYDPLFKKAFVKPSVDFEHLEEVFIIRLSPQWSAFRTELDSIEFDQ
ncbi:MAG: rod shape-determining protein MreC [Fibrobacterota bacterium]